MKIEQPEGDNLTFIGLENLPSTGTKLKSLSLPIPDAARSLAIPKTPKQSYRKNSGRQSGKGLDLL